MLDTKQIRHYVELLDSRLDDLESGEDEINHEYRENEIAIQEDIEQIVDEFHNEMFDTKTPFKSMFGEDIKKQLDKLTIIK